MYVLVDDSHEMPSLISSKNTKKEKRKKKLDVCNVHKWPHSLVFAYMATSSGCINFNIYFV